MTYGEADRAVEIAARVTGLPLIVDSHGAMGTRTHSWSISMGDTHTRLTPIGGLQEVYEWAHIIVRVAEKMRVPA